MNSKAQATQSWSKWISGSMLCSVCILLLAALVFSQVLPAAGSPSAGLASPSKELIHVSSDKSAALNRLRAAIGHPISLKSTESGVILFQHDGDLWWLSPSDGSRQRLTKTGDIWGFSATENGTIVVGREKKLFLLEPSGQYRLLAANAHGNPPLLSRNGDFIVAAKEAPNDALLEREGMKIVSDPQYNLVRVDLPSGKEAVVVGLESFDWPPSIRQRPDYNDKQWWGSLPMLLSPDGRQLLFRRAAPVIHDTAACDPWVTWNLDLTDSAGRPRALMSPAGDLKCVNATDWRGDLLLYDYWRDPRGLYVYDLSDHRSYLLRSGRVGLGTFSPDGLKLVYTDWTSEPDCEIKLLDLQSGADVVLSELKGGGTYPASWLWSPDSHYIVYTGGYQILAMELLTRRLIRLGPGDGPQWIRASQAAKFTPQRQDH